MANKTAADRRIIRRRIAIAAFVNAVALIWALVVGAFVGFGENAAAAIGAIGTSIASLLALVGWYMKMGSDENISDKPERDE